VRAHTSIRRRVPVEEYLRLQKRFAHLFNPVPDAPRIAWLQAMADANIERFHLFD
jgi:pyruvate ferredoxin oxidoreductase beta subunit